MMSSRRLIDENAPPMNVAYMKNLRFSLGLIDAWPHLELGSDRRANIFRSKFTLFIFWLVMLYAGISYLTNNLGVLSFVELGHSYITVLMNAVQLQRMTMVMTQSYGKAVAEFVTKIHLKHHKDRDIYSQKVFSQVEKISKIFTMVVHTQMVLGLMLFNLVPIFNNYKKGLYGSHKSLNASYEHAVYYNLPFNYTSNLNWSYFAVVLTNFIFTVDCASYFLNINLLLVVIVFHLRGHLKIMNHHLLTFPKPEMKGHNLISIENPSWYDDEENENILQLLKESINHHRLIKNYMGQASSAFGQTLCIYFLFHQITGCILLLECSKLDVDALARYLPVTFILNQQLIQLSIVIELLCSASEKLKDAAYSMPWECMNIKNRKILWFHLANLEEPLSLKALGMVPIGVQTMAKILKTSFQYFMFLRTFTTE